MKTFRPPIRRRILSARQTWRTRLKGIYLLAIMTLAPSQVRRRRDTIRISTRDSASGSCGHGAAVASETDGKIVIEGLSVKQAVKRAGTSRALTRRQSRRHFFRVVGANGDVSALFVQSDGKIVICRLHHRQRHGRNRIALKP